MCFRVATMVFGWQAPNSHQHRTDSTKAAAVVGFRCEPHSQARSLPQACRWQARPRCCPPGREARRRCRRRSRSCSRGRGRKPARTLRQRSVLATLVSAPAAAPPPPVPEETVRYRAGPAWDRIAPAPAPLDEDDAEFELAAAEERKRAAPRPRKAPKPAAVPKPAPRPSQWAKAPGHTVAKKGTGTAKGRLLAKLGKKRR